MLIDTHVHLNDETLYNELQKTIDEAFENNVCKMIVVGWDIASSKCAIEIAKQYDFCYAAIGVHPCNVRGVTDEDYNWLEQEAKVNPKVVAIGECGFDFHWEDTTKEEQIEAFVRQIEIAKRVGKPLSIHSREASQITFDTLFAHDASVVGGVIHAYSGNVELAREYIKRNFVLGIGGPVTFKNGRKMQEVVAAIDMAYLISETDSPYLTPEPYRGKVNGPKYIPYIVQKIAILKNMDLKEVEKQIEENTKRVFKI